MWPDMRLAVDHVHASEFVLTLLDVPGAQAPKPRDTQCQPQAQRKAGEMSNDARQAQWATMKMSKVGFFVFQDLNHGPYGRQRARRN